MQYKHRLSLSSTSNIVCVTIHTTRTCTPERLGLVFKNRFRFRGVLTDSVARPVILPPRFRETLPDFGKVPIYGRVNYALSAYLFCDYFLLEFISVLWSLYEQLELAQLVCYPERTDSSPSKVPSKPQSSKPIIQLSYSFIVVTTFGTYH